MPDRVPLVEQVAQLILQARRAVLPGGFWCHAVLPPERWPGSPGIRQARRNDFAASGSLSPPANGRFIDAYNQRCQPFAWTKAPDRVLAGASKRSPRAPGDGTRGTREPKAVRGTRSTGRLPHLGQQAAPMVGRPVRGLP